MRNATTAVLRNDSRTERYEYLVDGHRLAAVDYHEQDDGVVVLHHTWTEPEHRGRGHAACVVEYALEDLRARGRHIVPRCRYVAEFVTAHPEYRDLVAPA